jgi:hypothetical protein
MADQQDWRQLAARADRLYDDLARALRQVDDLRGELRGRTSGGTNGQQQATTITDADSEAIAREVTRQQQKTDMPLSSPENLREGMKTQPEAVAWHGPGDGT